jgi:hypothetical protein
LAAQRYMKRRCVAARIVVVGVPSHRLVSSYH